MRHLSFRSLCAQPLHHGALLLAAGLISPDLPAQPYGAPDRGQPGDPMIQEYLRLETEKVEADFLGTVRSAEAWEQARPAYHREYLTMLGLWPLPERTPLEVKVTGRLDRGDYWVDRLYYQSRPGLYVTANLYRPKEVGPGQRLPAVLYVCGHSSRGRDGNKTAFQTHGIWLARHGYVCLMVDTLQLGEIAGVHHGTYREGRWWWLSRGYTPAGVECWNGIRGIDYLVGRPDVDPERIGVTGISGGGAATFWIAAADERVSVAVPVSGMADLVSYVPNRVVNGHCDCMFLYNAYLWPWTRIAALVAPRPLLFINSDQDPIFPMDANERVITRLERLYSLFGAGDRVDSLVSVGGHAYREDIRQAAFRFLDIHLKNDSSPVSDTEVDLVQGTSPEDHPIPPEQLRVFPKDSDIPDDALNARIDQVFVPQAEPAGPREGAFVPWQRELLAGLRDLTFHHFPARIPPAQALEAEAGILRLVTETPLAIRLRPVRVPAGAAERIWLVVAASDVTEDPPAWMASSMGEQDALYLCEPRGMGGTQWTQKNPPNYVERAHYLLGRTVDSGRVWDLVATARYLQERHRGQGMIGLAGEGAGAVLAVYAALLEPGIASLILARPPSTLMDDSAPALLNALRICDVPTAVGMLAPRSVTLLGAEAGLTRPAAAIYQAAGAPDKLVLRGTAP